MIDPIEKAKLLRRIRTPGFPFLQPLLSLYLFYSFSSGVSLASRKQIYKKVVTLCKKATFPRVCAFCGALNGQVSGRKEGKEKKNVFKLDTRFERLGP